MADAELTADVVELGDDVLLDRIRPSLAFDRNCQREKVPAFVPPTPPAWRSTRGHATIPTRCVD
jgi:hypothetical protein